MEYNKKSYDSPAVELVEVKMEVNILSGEEPQYDIPGLGDAFEI